MAFNSSDHTLAQHFDKMNVKTESKYDEEILDEAIINGMKGEHRAFCLKIENLLNQYMSGQKVPEVIPNLDKYQRKIVHKICDLYNIKRDYVDVKPDETGSITISKTETSFMPTTSLEERYQKHLEKTKKQGPTQSSNPFANKKVLIKTRAAPTEKKAVSDKSDTKTTDTDKPVEISNVDPHDEVEHRKKKDYEQARDRIMQENEEKQIVPEIVDPNNPNKAPSKFKKKGRFEGYDPDYDRFKQSNPSNMSNNMPIGLGPMPGMGMPNMYPMPGMPMPGMGGMPNMPGYYPMHSQPYIPFPGYSMPNQNFQPNMGQFNNYGGPPPQYQGGNQQQQQQVNTGQQGPTGGPGTYYQSFPSLGRDNSGKK